MPSTLTPQQLDVCRRTMHRRAAEPTHAARSVARRPEGLHARPQTCCARATEPRARSPSVRSPRARTSASARASTWRPTASRRRSTWTPKASCSDSPPASRSTSSTSA